MVLVMCWETIVYECALKRYALALLEVAYRDARGYI